MRRLMWTVPVVVFVPLLWAFDDPKEKPKTEQKQPQEKPATPAQEFRALKLEFDTARLESAKALREAKTDEEKNEARDKAPKTEDFAAKFRELANKYPKDPVAVDSLMWIVTNLRTAPDADKAIDELLKNHIESEKLIAVLAVIGNARTPSRSTEPRLRLLLEKSPHKSIQGPACFTLAQLVKNRADAAARANSPAAERVAQEAEKLFQRVIDDFGDVRSGRGTLADAAKGDLFELKFLSIGKVAPDIAGEDVEGVPFKLTDYRGKVVVLDFWGHW